MPALGGWEMDAGALHRDGHGDAHAGHVEHAEVRPVAERGRPHVRLPGLADAAGGRQGPPRFRCEAALLIVKCI